MSLGLALVKYNSEPREWSGGKLREKPEDKSNLYFEQGQMGHSLSSFEEKVILLFLAVGGLAALLSIRRGLVELEFIICFAPFHLEDDPIVNCR